MKLSNTLAMAILAATSCAAPNNAWEPIRSTTKVSTTTTKAIATTTKKTSATPTPSGYQCSNNQVPACCNTSKDPLPVASGLSGLLDGLLEPGECIKIPIVGPLLEDLLSFCGSTSPECCNNNQTGLINLNLAQCVAIVL